MARDQLKQLAWLVLLAAVLPATACTGKFTQTLKSSQLDGWADDGDPAQPRDTYNSQQNKFTAFDGTSKGRSSPAKWDRLEGETHAIPGPNSDGANAGSNNKMRSEFKVTAGGGGNGFTFGVDVKVFGLQIVGTGTFKLETSVTVFDAQGNIVNDAAGRQSTNLILGVANDPTGKAVATPGGAAGQGMAPPAINAGQIKVPFTAGNGVALPPGIYEIQLEMNLQAIAPDKKSSVLASASATIKKN
jgi:hypothetical protein